MMLLFLIMTTQPARATNKEL